MSKNIVHAPPMRINAGYEELKVTSSFGDKSHSENRHAKVDYLAYSPMYEMHLGNFNTWFVDFRVAM
jgi:hypothetical protein